MARRTTKTEVTMASAYNEYADIYEGSARKYWPLAVKQEIFRREYPNGCICVSNPERDTLAEGIICRCDIYADAGNKEMTHLASSFGRRVSAVVDDEEIDVFAAVRAAAISSALTLAGIEIPVADMFVGEKDTDEPETEAPVEEKVEKPKRSRRKKEAEIPEEVEKDSLPVEEPSEHAEPSEPAEAVSEDVSEEASEEQAPEQVNEPAEVPSDNTVSEEVKTPVEAEPAVAETEEAPVETPSNPELEELIKETGKSYEDAIAHPFAHQTRKGVFGDLLADQSSRALLAWFAKPGGMFGKKNPEDSKIARIIVLHDNL